MYYLLAYTLLCLGCAWTFRRWYDRRSILLAKDVPANKMHLLFGFGHMLDSKGTVRTLWKAVQRYGKNVLVYVGPFPIFLTTDPVVVKDVLSSNQCVKKAPIFYDRLKKGMGRGLITLNDPEWHADRKVLNTAFNNKNLMSFLPIFNEESNNLLKNIDRAMENKSKAPLIDHFRRFTVHIAMRTTIGRKLGPLDIKEDDFKNITGALEYLSALMFHTRYFIGIIRKLAQLTVFRKPWASVELLKSLIHEALNGLSEKREDDSSYESNINTVLDYMSKGIKQNAIKEEYAVDGLFHIFAGAFETTSTSLYFILLMLAMNPECQQRAYEEICTIFPDNDEDDDDEQFEVTHEHFSQMVYLDMIINETWRVLPIIPQVARSVTDRDLKLSNGLTLPKGQIVLIDIFSMHRSKEIWGPDAGKFNPDNFLPCNIETKHPYAFIPFTKGVRFCIGWRYGELSVKLALSKLIKRYKFSTTAKLKDLKIENHITSQLTTHPLVNIQKRRKAKTI